MGATSTNQNIIIERSYAPKEEACTRAIQTLLRSKKAAHRGGPDAERRSDELGATNKYSG